MADEYANMEQQCPPPNISRILTTLPGSCELEQQTINDVFTGKRAMVACLWLDVVQRSQSAEDAN